MLNIVCGDLVGLAEDGHFDVIFHGAHCQNYMGGDVSLLM